VAVHADGQRAWEDYFAGKYVLDADQGGLVCTGRVEGLPLEYERRYAFADAAVEIQLTLRAQEDVALTALLENVPVLGGSVKSNGAEIAVADEKPETAANSRIRKSTAVADRFRIADKSGRGVDVILDKPRSLRICRSGLGVDNYISRSQINRVEIALPETLRKGEVTELTYRLVPRDADP